MAKEVNEFPFATYLGSNTVTYGGGNYTWNGRYYVMNWGLLNGGSSSTTTSAGTTSTTTAAKGSTGWFVNGGASAISSIISSVGSLVSGIVISTAQAKAIKTAGGTGVINPITGQNQVVEQQSNIITFVAIGLAGVVVILLIKKK